MSCMTGNCGGSASNNFPLHQEQLDALYGGPLSSKNARATQVGSIPNVIRWANFTLVDCQVAPSTQSAGGIANLDNFWRGKPGVYGGDFGDFDTGVCGDY